jgi:CheY-like chemotaxis protein/anti-sigma regulatory factor (Ser/Thr protein kinase)
MELYPEPFDLHHLVETAMNVYRFKAEEKQLAFTYTIDNRVPRYVVGDHTKIRQVLSNIISNAVKFTSTGSIALSVRQGNGDTAFVISDTGVGIPAAEIPSLFESFKQVENRPVAAQKGTGLGLAIAERLASMMGGSIEVESTVGEGSTFTFAVPLHPTTEETPITVKTEQPHPHEVNNVSLSILVAEDEKINQIYLKRYLESEGHHVILADNGREAVKRFLSYSFDIIFMDIHMPEMDGIEAIKQIREHENQNKLGQTPIVALTAYALVDDKKRMINVGANRYITKPIKEQELEAILFDHYPSSENQSPTLATMKKNLDTLYIDRLKTEYLGDEDKLAAIIDIVKHDLPQRIEQLKQSHKNNDFETAARAIHSVTNISGTLRHKQLLQYSQQMEESIRKNHQLDLSRLERIEKMTEQIVRELQLHF